MSTPSSYHAPGPQRVGRYTLGPLLGRGGFGQVFLARSDRLSRFVALKLIHSHLLEQEGYLEMFEHEARVASQLSHPNLVRILEAGQADDFHYIAMDFVSGVSLSRLLQARLAGASEPSGIARMLPADATLPALGEASWYRFAAAVVSGAARGIHAAHTTRGPDGELLGLVHRDLAPSNIMLTFEGIPTVLDFGIALSHGRSFKTRTGVFHGHTAYASPEHLLDDAVDARADVWSLGVVLWELLSGQRLFDRTASAKVVLAVLNGSIPDPRHVNPEVPNELAACAMAALHRDPRARCRDALSLAKRLDAFLAVTPGPLPCEVIGATLRTELPHAEREQQALLASATEGRTPSEGESGPKRIEVRDELPTDASFQLPLPVRPTSSPPSPRRFSWPLAVVVALFAGGILALASKQFRSSETMPRGPAEQSVETSSMGTSPTPSSHELTPAMGAREIAPGSSRGPVEAGLGSAPRRADEAIRAGGAAPSPSDERSEAPAAGASRASPVMAPGSVNTAADEARPAREMRDAPMRTSRQVSERRSRRTTPRSSAAGIRMAPRRSTARPTQRAPIEPGRLRVVTPGGWARVRVDGRERGHTPKAFSLPAGTHAVEVRFPGGEVAQRRVRIKPGETSPLVIRAPE